MCPLQSLLRSDLPLALENALRADERTALDVMRLVELLLVLIMEGRKALPKTSNLTGLPHKADSFTGDRNHRQVTALISHILQIYNVQCTMSCACTCTMYMYMYTCMLLVVYYTCTCTCTLYVQVIEAIRSSNNDEFFEAMESGKNTCGHTLHVYVYTCVYSSCIYMWNMQCTV